MLPKAAATSGATPGPMWRIDNAIRKRSNGLDLACSRLASSFVPLADSRPSLVVKNGTPLSFSSVSPNRSPSSVISPASSSAIALR